MPKTPAQLAYEGYATNIQHREAEDILPRWEQLPAHIQRAWAAAAEEVLRGAREIPIPLP